MRKVGILGGTFNPIHWGHLLVAESALTQASLSCILWVPTVQSPYKSVVQPVPLHHRCQMVKRAIESHPQFVLTADATTPAATYAIDTLQILQRHYGLCDWHWIVGLDAFRSLPRWVGRRELIPQCTWLVAPRSVSTQPDAVGTGAVTVDLQLWGQQIAEQLLAEAIVLKWQALDMPLVQISSSLVRRYCEQGRSIRYLVPDAVSEYIAAQALYKL